MLREDQTCPRCGALVTPQLARCRQCGRYLHGSPVEGFLVEHLFPESFAHAPGTALLALYCILVFLLMILLAGPEALGGFRPLMLLQLGSTVSTEIQDGEWWRFLASVFTHGDLLHIVFNLYVLSVAGPLVEQLYDRRRVVTFFVLTGALAGFGGYVWRAWILGQPFVAGSVGASGAIAGLIGVAWAATRNPRSEGRDAHAGMTRWAVLLLLWGLVPRVDGAAHFVGLVAGAGLGSLVPEGVPQRRWQQRIWTSAALACLCAMGGATAATLIAAQDQPYRVENDAYPRTLLFFTLAEGTPWARSGQNQAWERCSTLATEVEAEDGDLAAALDACELTIRVLPAFPGGHLLLGRLLALDGQSARAARQVAIAERLSGR